MNPTDLSYNGNSLRYTIATALLVLVALVCAAGCLLEGSVSIPASDVWGAVTGGEVSKDTWRIIVTDMRLPMVITAAMAGAALSLAGPSILGISTGASLGVAVVVLYFGGMVADEWGQYFNIMVGALVGAAVVIAILLGMSRIVRSTAMLLIVGILTGYFASSIISLLNYHSSQEGIYSYTIWGLGSFAGSTPGRSGAFAAVALPAILLAMLMIKPLNAMLLGERYAESLGIDIRRVRYIILSLSGILTALVTAFCGPIGFLGLIVPHVARMMLRTSNHSVLLPVTALAGAAIALLCAFISVRWGGDGIIPINAITPIVGVPVIVYVIVCRKKLMYFD